MTSDAVTTDSTPSRRIDAVLYDFGNVLVTWDPYLAYAGRMERADVDRFFAEVDFPAFNWQQDAGRSWADARTALALTHPHHVDAMDLYVDNFAATLAGPVPGSADLVRELKELGLRLYGLTNWSAELFGAAEPAAPAIGLMEDVVVSAHVGLAKPDPKIFELAIERFGLDPARTLFVDDSAANVVAAGSVGLIVAHFQDVGSLRGVLRDLGVDVGVDMGGAESDGQPT